MSFELFSILFEHQAPVAGICYLATLLCIILDFTAGVRKALASNTYHGSIGLRRTFTKMIQYFNVLLALSVFDMVILLSYAMLWEVNRFLPFLTVFGCLFLCTVETISIFEKVDRKQQKEARKAAALLSSIATSEKGRNTLQSLLNLLAKQSNGDGVVTE